MNHYRQLFVLVVFFLIVSISCNKAPEEIPVSSVSLNKTSLELVIGESVQLNATVNPSDATQKTITWSSSNQAVATVAGGKVTAVSEGSSTITANAGGKSATCSVTVKKKTVDVTSVVLNKTDLSLTEGDSETLVATIKPDDATDKTVIWSSSDATIVTVDNGKVTAIKEGSATVAAKAGDKTATCKVSVTKKVIPVTEISLDFESLTLVEGEEKVLVATVKPDDATDKGVTWSTSKSDVATVENGKVVAVKEGEAVISAKAGEKSATCKVIVNKKVVAVSSVELNKNTIELVEGESETLVATVKPDDATDKTVTWSSSDESIAIVENGKVSAIKEGSATITATAGDKDATCKVTILKKEIAVESVSLNQATLTLYEGQSSALVATVKPDNATNKTVTWSSSASGIATVDQEGIVLAIKAGSATITAKAGEKQATCQVTVQELPKVSSITFNTQSFNGYIGSDYFVSVSVSPEIAQYDLEWTISDTRVANIQANGTSAKIHTNDYGIADIGVKDKISGKTATITISTSVTDFVWTENTGETYYGYPLITIEEGQDYQLHFSCSPSSATKLFSDLSQFVFYEPNVVSTPSCVAISEDGLVHGIKEGIVGIKATGRIIKGSTGVERVYIKVKAATVPVQSISLNKSTLSLKEGESETLIATISPTNATSKSVYWTSDKTGIATVDQNGKVTAIAEGKATITASAGNYSATCTVTVEKNVVVVTSITLNKSSINLLVGGNETLIATVLPDDATDKTVTWSSKNESIATVKDGKVTAVTIGKTTISAKAGNKTAECTVIVTSSSAGGNEGIGYDE